VKKLLLTLLLVCCPLMLHGQDFVHQFQASGPLTEKGVALPAGVTFNQWNLSWTINGVIDTLLGASPALVGVVNTQNGSSGSCTQNCVLQQSGSNFSTIVGNTPIVINGFYYMVSSVQSNTLLTLTTAPGTQTGVAYQYGGECPTTCWQLIPPAACLLTVDTSPDGVTWTNGALFGPNCDNPFLTSVGMKLSPNSTITGGFVRVNLSAFKGSACPGACSINVTLKSWSSTY